MTIFVLRTCLVTAASSSARGTLSVVGDGHNYFWFYYLREFQENLTPTMNCLLPSFLAWEPLEVSLTPMPLKTESQDEKKS